MTTPALRLLRSHYPKAEITVLIKEAYSSVLADNPHVDRVVELPPARRWLESLRVFRRVVNTNFDIVVDFYGSGRTAVVSRLTSAPKRVGYDHSVRSWLYTDRVERGPDGVYAARVRLNLLAPLGLDTDDLTLCFHVPEWADRRLQAWCEERGLRADRPLIVLSPASRKPSCRWRPEYFARVAEKIHSDPGVQIVVSVAPWERDLADEIAFAAGCDVVVATMGSIQELGALFKRASLRVGVDSGTKHLAVAVGTPTVTLYGPTRPEIWEPPTGPHDWIRRTIVCRDICGTSECVGPRCTDTISPKDVITLVRRRLQTSVSQGS